MKKSPGVIIDQNNESFLHAPRVRVMFVAEAWYGSSKNPRSAHPVLASVMPVALTEKTAAPEPF